MRAIPKLAAFRPWKWLVGAIYIVLAVVLLLLGRITLFCLASASFLCDQPSTSWTHQLFLGFRSLCV
jgi:hypothetical protein